MRYVLFDQRHLEQSKVKAAEALISATGLTLAVETSDTVIRQHLKDHPDERKRLDLLVCAVDTYGDRRSIASELPREILNAGTTPSDFTISRHGFGDGFACLACLYPVAAADIDEDAVAGRELGLPKTEVAQMRRDRSGLTVEQLMQIARHRDEPNHEHLAYTGQPLDSFYNKVICATTPVDTRRGEARAPLAQGSALAGFLLARALAAREGARHFRMDFMSHPDTPIRTSKRPRPRCQSCGQETLVEAYREKWNVADRAA
jgi:hypothetical protein